MKVLLRADAGVGQGTGHVMRCLTLAETLLARGHTVELMTTEISIEWLAATIGTSGLTVRECEPDELPTETILQSQFDWVIVDSYRIAANAISTMNGSVPVLAVIDNEDRGIQATLYLDQNLGAENVVRPASLRGHVMSGAKYALVRDAVLAQRREEPWCFISEPPTVLSFMGGTDPTQASRSVAEILVGVQADFKLTIIAPSEQHDLLRHILGGRPLTQLLPPTPLLPALIGEADIILSAAGTSAWDVCALGLPAVLVAVVDNQRTSLKEAVSRGLVLGINAIDDASELYSQLEPHVLKLLEDTSARHDLSERCLKTFDGEGRKRVIEQLEKYDTGRKGRR